jgi:hypothetical protein
MDIANLNQPQRKNESNTSAQIATIDNHIDGPGLDHEENKIDKSALLTNMLELLKEKEPELCSPALKRLEERREHRHNP